MLKSYLAAVDVLTDAASRMESVRDKEARTGLILSVLADIEASVLMVEQDLRQSREIQGLKGLEPDEFSRTLLQFVDIEDMDW